MAGHLCVLGAAAEDAQPGPRFVPDHRTGGGAHQPLLCRKYQQGPVSRQEQDLGRLQRGH